MLLWRLLLIALSAVTAIADGRDLDLILYGADGCVGHLAAKHLATQEGLKWAIAGRTESKLKELVANLSKAGGASSKPEIIVASLDAKSDTNAWVRRAKAVATAAGPFSKHGGEYLVKACAEEGVHYADTSDEFYWQRWMIDNHDATARASGARVVLSSGFCALAGDLGSQLAMEGLKSDESAVVSVDAWLEAYNGGLSAGVIHTAHALANASYPKEWNTDPYVLAENFSQDLRVDTSVEGIHNGQYITGEGIVVSNVFGPYDARLLRRSFGRLGQKVHFRVGALPTLYAKWSAFLVKHGFHWKSMATCPDQSILDDGSWSYRFKASAGQASHSVLLSGTMDPGYHFTSWGLAEAGLCLSGRTPNCLRAAAEGTSGGGVQTVMAAMSPDGMRQRLEMIGLLKVSTTTVEEAIVV